MNIIQIHEMIDTLEDFVSNPMMHSFFAGGIIGSGIFGIGLNSLLTKYEFTEICVIEGCQDYIGMRKKPVIHNYFYYKDLFADMVSYDPKGINSYERGFMVWNPMKLKYTQYIDTRKLSGFKCLIINDCQLIDRNVVNALIDSFPGKVLCIFDPLEPLGESYMGYPFVIDSLTRLSVINALARNVFGISTRSIDKSVKCSVKESKIPKRSIGKNTPTQFITDNKFFAEEVAFKQKLGSFKKGQRLWVTDTRIRRLRDDDGFEFTITKDSLLVIERVHVLDKRLKLRLWNTTITFSSEVLYTDDIDELSMDIIAVKPANIITTDMIKYHKFPNTVLVTNEPLSQRDQYVLLKNTNNLVVGT